MKKVIFLKIWFLFSFTPLLLLGQDGYQLTKDIYYRSNLDKVDTYMAEKCLVDVYVPSNQKGFSTIVWFYGGGLVGGEKYIPEVLKNQGIAIVAVEYRHSPKVTNPAYTEDAAAAIAWVFNNIEKYGGSRSKIYVAGHSSGAYLVSMVGLDKSFLAKYNIEADSIKHLFPFSGQCITHQEVRRERGIDVNKPLIDQYAPSYHVRPDAPPITLITGGRELDNPARYEENEYFYRMLKVVGHPKAELFELQGFNHGTMVNPACRLMLNIIKAEEKM